MENPKRPIITVKKKKPLEIAGLLSGLSVEERAELARILNPAAPASSELLNGVPKDTTVDQPIAYVPPTDLSKLPPPDKRVAAGVQAPKRVWGDPRWLK